MQSHLGKRKFAGASWAVTPADTMDYLTGRWGNMSAQPEFRHRLFREPEARQFLWHYRYCGRDQSWVAGTPAEYADMAAVLSHLEHVRLTDIDPAKWGARCPAIALWLECMRYRATMGLDVGARQPSRATKERRGY
jgi:hypothetical protein